MKRPSLSYDKARKKIWAYCAYQERCHKEVRNKLSEWGIWGDWQDELLVDLIENNFLNEQRFAIAFVGGKFRQKKWGRNKILRALKEKDISDYCIRKAFESEVNEVDYMNTLEQVIQKKARLTKEPNVYKKKQKLAQHAMRYGFESHLIWEVLNNEIEEEKE